MSLSGIHNFSRLDDGFPIRIASGMTAMATNGRLMPIRPSFTPLPSPSYIVHPSKAMILTPFEHDPQASVRRFFCMTRSECTKSALYTKIYNNRIIISLDLQRSSDRYSLERGRKLLIAMLGRKGLHQRNTFQGSVDDNTA